MVPYLQSQLNRMNNTQIELINRLASIDENDWQKEERDRATKLYMWLHMEPGSVSHRSFAPRRQSMKKAKR